MSIKNVEVERLARELASLRRVSMTEAIRQVLAEAIARESPKKKPWSEEKKKRIDAIIAEVAKLPRRTDLTEDEILGYDEFGIPSR